jgi:hypothetical protein
LLVNLPWVVGARLRQLCQCSFFALFRFCFVSTPFLLKLGLASVFLSLFLSALPAPVCFVFVCIFLLPRTVTEGVSNFENGPACRSCLTTFATAGNAAMAWWQATAKQQYQQPPKLVLE